MPDVAYAPYIIYRKPKNMTRGGKNFLLQWSALLESYAKDFPMS